MILRLLSAVFLAWAFGFVWFFATLPAPAGDIKTDAVIVPTGAAGRIQRGLEVLDKGWAERMLVSGVDLEVRPDEFAAEFDVSRGNATHVHERRLPADQFRHHLWNQRGVRNQLVVLFRKLV